MENKDISLKDSPEELRARIETLRAENALLLLRQDKLTLEKDVLLAEKDKLLSEVIEENKHLRHQLNQLLQDKFGVKSEKSKNLAEHAFNEAIEPDNALEIEVAEKEITVAIHQRKKGGKCGRKPLPEHLPRIQRIYDLEESERICCCGCQLVKIGEELSEQLDIIPAKIQVIQHIKYKHACKGCFDTIKTAPGPKLPIPKSIASPGLLAHVSVSKFKDHLPLYRQESIFQRMGVDIARNTLSLWIIKTAQVLVPLYKLCQDTMTSYDVGYADETRVQVLKEPNRKAEDKAYMWCFIGGPSEQRCVIYHYNISRAHTVIEEILEGFSGFLHCDGFSGYDAYAVDHDVKLVGCWMHCRRNFFEVARSTKSKGLADAAVAMIGKLYGIEEEMRDKAFPVEQRYEHRQRYSKPLLQKFKAFLDENIKKVLPKFPLGKAFSYAINQWSKLTRYIEDGRLEIDNGLSERKVKPFVIGRKNWLFFNSIAGVKAAEVLFSIIETCALHKIEPYAYLRFVLTEIPKAKTMEDIECLMPFNIKPEQLTIDFHQANTS
jgi:transposase